MPSEKITDFFWTSFSIIVLRGCTSSVALEWITNLSKDLRNKILSCIYLLTISDVYQIQLNNIDYFSSSLIKENFKLFVLTC